MSGPPASAEYGLMIVYFGTLMALVCDLKIKKVPPLLTWPMISAGLAIGFALGGVAGTATDAMGLMVSTQPSLVQSLLSMAFVVVLFGVPTLKGSFGKGDFALLIGVASLSCLRPFLTILMGIGLCCLVVAPVYLMTKGMMGSTFKAFWSRATLKGRLRDDQGRLDPVHELTLPFSPMVVGGVFLTGGGWGWS